MHLCTYKNYTYIYVKRVVFLCPQKLLLQQRDFSLYLFYKFLSSVKYGQVPQTGRWLYYSTIVLFDFFPVFRSTCSISSGSVSSVSVSPLFQLFLFLLSCSALSFLWRRCPASVTHSYLSTPTSPPGLPLWIRIVGCWVCWGFSFFAHAVRKSMTWTVFRVTHFTKCFIFTQKLLIHFRNTIITYLRVN